jgi:hypothetical protein
MTALQRETTAAHLLKRRTFKALQCGQNAFFGKQTLLCKVPGLLLFLM